MLNQNVYWWQRNVKITHRITFQTGILRLCTKISYRTLGKKNIKSHTVSIKIDESVNNNEVKSQIRKCRLRIC